MTRSHRRPLKLGIILPTLERRGSGHPADFTRRWPDLLAMARRAEALGVDSLWVPDHLLFRWSKGKMIRKASGRAGRSCRPSRR